MRITTTPIAAAAAGTRGGSSRSTSAAFRDLQMELLERGSTTSRTTNGGRREISFNYRKAFAVMSERRVQRVYKGVYVKYSIWMQIFTWLLVIYILGVFAADIIRAGVKRGELFSWDNAFASLVNLFLVFIIVEIALVIRWIVYWIIIAELAMLMVTGSVKAMVWQDDRISETDKKARRIILITLLVMESLTIATHVITHYIYPWCVRKQLINAERWWLVQPGSRDNTFTYRSKSRICRDKRSLVTYCGGLNAHGEPHGFGVWTDTSFHGEHLRGQWENGVPIGPFSSREHGSGYCFVNRRIAYCQNRAETRTDQHAFFPRHSKLGLQWGVASVECSVSGGFFRFLPSVTHLTEPNNKKSPRSAQDCLPVLRTPMDMAMLGGDVRRRRDSQPRPHPDGPPSTRGLVDREPEALVFLHGYNCSLDYALNRLGQLLALGDFPPNIHPFVFSWPSGGTLAYFQARAIGAESEATAKDFKTFLQSLVEAGYQYINIVAHSMGARIYFKALNLGLLDDVFVHLPESMPQYLDHGPLTIPAQRARLSTLTFCNPDYARTDFVRRGGGYDLTRRFCTFITLYGDHMDNALVWSEILSRQSLFDPLVYSMGKRVQMLHRDPDEAKQGPRRHRRARAARWSLFQQDRECLAIEIGEEVTELNEKGQFPGVARIALNHRPRDTLANTVDGDVTAAHDGDPCEEIDDDDDDDDVNYRGEPREFLDMDVIDTTWMDNNVHAVRHNYFNLNPTMIDDLRQVIVAKRRARSRSGLLRTVANVHIFLVAPAHITND